MTLADLHQKEKKNCPLGLRRGLEANYEERLGFALPDVAKPSKRSATVASGRHAARRRRRRPRRGSQASVSLLRVERHVKTLLCTELRF